MTTTTDKQRTINAALDLRGAELREQAILHTQMLDTFLSYPTEERARVWRGMQPVYRNTLVSAMLIKSYDDWSEASVTHFVTQYNEKWGSEPTDADAQAVRIAALPLLARAQAGALETLATQADIALRAATTADERSFARRESNAANKALDMFSHGVRPTQIDDAWLVRSATQAGTVYRVSSTGCTCEAGLNGRPCWHASLVTGIEMGYDVVEGVDDAQDTEEAIDLPEPIDLGRRIAAARALVWAA